MIIVLVIQFFHHRLIIFNTNFKCFMNVRGLVVHFRVIARVKRHWGYSDFSSGLEVLGLDLHGKQT